MTIITSQILFLETLSVIAYLHEKRILYRDFKTREYLFWMLMDISGLQIMGYRRL